LLDVGNQLGLKSSELTRNAALSVINRLFKGTRFAVMQFALKPELIQPWTTDKANMERVLKRGMLSGKSSRLPDALAGAIGASLLAMVAGLPKSKAATEEDAARLAAAGVRQTRARQTRVPEGNVPEEVGQARRGGGPHEPHHRAVDQAKAIEVVHRG